MLEECITYFLYRVKPNNTRVNNREFKTCVFNKVHKEVTVTPTSGFAKIISLIYYKKPPDSDNCNKYRPKALKESDSVNNRNEFFNTIPDSE